MSSPTLSGALDSALSRTLSGAIYRAALAHNLLRFCMRVIPIAALDYVRACAYFQNGLSLRKQCCNVCGVAADCDHIDNAEPFVTEVEGKVFNAPVAK